MSTYRVREGYVVHFEGGRTLSAGETFEPSPDVLARQSWKIEPVLAATREMLKPPRDRAIKRRDARNRS